MDKITFIKYTWTEEKPSRYIGPLVEEESNVNYDGKKVELFIKILFKKQHNGVFMSDEEDYALSSSLVTRKNVIQNKGTNIFTSAR